MKTTELNTNSPFLLLIFAAVYLVVGIGCTLKAIASGNPEYLAGLTSFALGYGVFTRRRWSLVLFRIFVILEAITITPVIILHQINDVSNAKIMVFGFTLEVNLTIVLALAVGLIILQAVVVFSEKIKPYFKNI